MLLKAVNKIKGLRWIKGYPINRISFDDSEGFIGKSVPCTPTFLGYFILKQSGYFEQRLAHSKAILVKGAEREVVCYAY